MRVVSFKDVNMRTYYVSWYSTNYNSGMINVKITSFRANAEYIFDYSREISILVTQFLLIFCNFFEILIYWSYVSIFCCKDLIHRSLATNICVCKLSHYRLRWWLVTCSGAKQFPTTMLSYCLLYHKVLTQWFWIRKLQCWICDLHTHFYDWYFEQLMSDF